MEIKGTDKFRGYKVSVLRTAFDLVADPADWKGPIKAKVPAAAIDLVCAAIEFFTALIPKVIILDVVKDEYLVVCPGYRLGPAGDH